MSFSMKLKELRLQNSLTQEQLARKINTTTRTYIFYETGKKYPPVDLLIRIAKFYKVSVSFLLDEDDEYGRCEKLGAKQLVEQISDLFAGDELSETDKDNVMEALQEVYRNAKTKQ